MKLPMDELAQTLFEEAGDGLFFFAPEDGQLLDINPMAQRLTGFARQDLLSMSVKGLFSAEVDGGMARSDPFLQFQADLLGLRLARSPQVESTALGAALLAGLGVGLWPNAAAAAELLQAGGRVFEPARDQAWRDRVRSRWGRAVEGVKAYYRGSSDQRS